MKRKILLGIGVLFLVFGLMEGANALATTLTMNNGYDPNGWSTFHFGYVDSSWCEDDLLNNEVIYQFTLTDTAYLAVTDGFLYGDQFEVFDGTTSLGVTSFPIATSGSATSFDSAFHDNNWSSGVFVLSAGTYEIWGKVIYSVLGDFAEYYGEPYSGQGGIQLYSINSHGTAVPEPATMLLFGVGLVGLAGVTRRKLKK